MKSYNRLIALSIGVCMLFALAAGYGMRHLSDEQAKKYNVEINRIHQGLSGKDALDKLTLQSYKFVEEITFLPIEEEAKEAKTAAFYRKKNNLEMQILPWYLDRRLIGYVRYDYRENTKLAGNTLILSETLLIGMGLFFIAVLFYLRFKLIKPFHRLSNLPNELAKGHLKGDIKEEKSRYFGSFLWGIGLLKDQLEVTRKRSLTLEKEKKLMLLSLSHDIKTPLNTIKLYSKALFEDIYKEETAKKQAALKIGVKAEEIERYVEEIMKTSREDILDIKVENQDFYLKDLMLKVLSTYEEKCAVRMLELKVGPFENRLLKGDIDRSVEVFENLFENAFKYGDGRKISITFYEEDYCQLIRIFNTGAPVTDNEFNHIFESFFRAANSKGKQGNGLGLYICREIMRKMGGEIFAEKEDNGMAFVLVFR